MWLEDWHMWEVSFFSIDYCFSKKLAININILYLTLNMISSLKDEWIMKLNPPFTIGTIFQEEMLWIFIVRFKSSIPYLLDLIYALCVFVSIHVRLIKNSSRYLDFSLTLKQFHGFFIAIPVAYCGIVWGAWYVYETWINTVGGPILTSISNSRPWIGSCYDLWF